MSILDINSAQFLDLAGEILNQGHRLRFHARGISMRPVIRDGDLLEIEAVPVEVIRRGDILLYRIHGSHLLVHRVIQIRPQPEGRLFLIQGDALLQADGWIPGEHILGRVRRLERPGARRDFSSPLQRLFARSLAVLLPVYKRGYAFYKSIKK